MPGTYKVVEKELTVVNEGTDEAPLFILQIAYTLSDGVDTLTYYDKTAFDLITGIVTSDIQAVDEATLDSINNP